MRSNSRGEAWQWTAPSPRQRWIDTVKGTAIVLVVLGHAYGLQQEYGWQAHGLWNDVNILLGLWRMPVFMVVAGFFVTRSLEKYGIELIGADFDAIQRGEDRQMFKDIVAKVGGESARSRVCHTMEEVRETVADLGYPVVVRPSFTMGGLGSGMAYNEDDLDRIAGGGLAASPTANVLIEESILGWKEYELELMRDNRDNVVVVCSIENVDPVGVHTGDSITVAPAMTLTDREYQKMRDLSINILREVGVDTGGCNIQYAVNPADGRLIATAAQAEIKIGVVVPVTGPNAAFGAQIKTGAQQAIADINKAGGVNGEKLVMTVGDDASDPKQGVSVANKFASEGVKAVVGAFNSGVSIPVSDVLQEAGIVEVSPASTAIKYTERGNWNTFRTCGRDDQQGAVAGAYLAEKFKGKKIAFVHDKTPYGRGLADETRKVYRAKGGKDVIYEGINPGEKDYSALVSKLKQANVDVVYYGGIHTEAGLLVRQMRDQGLKAPLMGGDGIADREFAQVAGPGSDGTLMTFSPDARKNPKSKATVDAFKAMNFDPEGYTLYSYAAVQILKAAIEATGSTDGKALADYLHQGKPTATVIGEIAYDKKGDITRPDYVMYVWKKNASGAIDYAGNEVGQ